MKLYDFSIAPNPRIVRMYLAEKGVNIPVVQVDLMRREQLTPEFRSKNPQCDVPVLELDDGQCISQVMAICRYIEELYPAPPLLGRTALERAQVEMWNHIVFLNGMTGMSEALRNRVGAFVDRAVVGPYNLPQIPELVTRGLKRLKHFYEDINERLAQVEYIAGDYFSIADISTLAVVDFAKNGKIQIPEESGYFKRWYDLVSQRPSASA